MHHKRCPQNAAPPKWLKRTLVGLLTLGVLLVVAGLSYRAIASARDQRTFTPPGRLVDVGGYSLHLKVMGEGKGGPTVILDPASQSASFEWGWVQPEVAEFTRVVAYDRPGTGWSDAPPEPMSAREVAEDLHEALESIGVEGPEMAEALSLQGEHRIVRGADHFSIVTERRDRVRSRRGIGHGS